jgi:ABC-type phosphate transport system substrate-binding protein
MARRWSALALGAALAAVAVAGPASGAGDQLTSTWAQLNVCNPAQLGARAQLAGDGSSTEMADGWVPLSGKFTSPWQNAGSAEFTWQQAGWTFSLNVPQGGEAYQLRAVADMRLGSGRTAQYTTGTCTVGG